MHLLDDALVELRSSNDGDIDTDILVAQCHLNRGTTLSRLVRSNLSLYSLCTSHCT